MQFAKLQVALFQVFLTGDGFGDRFLLTNSCCSINSDQSSSVGGFCGNSCFTYPVTSHSILSLLYSAIARIISVDGISLRKNRFCHRAADMPVRCSKYSYFPRLGANVSAKKMRRSRKSSNFPSKTCARESDASKHISSNCGHIPLDPFLQIRLNDALHVKTTLNTACRTPVTWFIRFRNFLQGCTE